MSEKVRGFLTTYNRPILQSQCLKPNFTSTWNQQLFSDRQMTEGQSRA